MTRSLDISPLPLPLAYCNRLWSNETDLTLQAVLRREVSTGRAKAIGMPDQPDAGDAGRPLEPDRHPRHHVRQPAPFPRAADGIRGRDRLQHPRRPAEAAGRGGAADHGATIRPTAEGHLQPDRAGDPAGAAARPDGRLGAAAHAGDARPVGARGRCWRKAGRRCGTEFMDESAAPSISARPARTGTVPVSERLRAAYEAAVAEGAAGAEAG